MEFTKILGLKGSVKWAPGRVRNVFDSHLNSIKVHVP